MPDPSGGGSFDAALALFTAAVDIPGAMDLTITLPFGRLPAPMVIELLKFDLLVHCWDLASATGQQFDPPADAVEHGLEVAKVVISREMRNGDTFAEEATVRVQATSIERLAAFTGRSV